MLDWILYKIPRSLAVELIKTYPMDRLRVIIGMTILGRLFKTIIGENHLGKNIGVGKKGVNGK